MRYTSGTQVKKNILGLCYQLKTKHTAPSKAFKACFTSSIHMYSHWVITTISTKGGWDEKKAKNAVLDPGDLTGGISMWAGNRVRLGEADARVGLWQVAGRRRGRARARADRHWGARRTTAPRAHALQPAGRYPTPSSRLHNLDFDYCLAASQFHDTQTSRHWTCVFQF